MVCPHVLHREWHRATLLESCQMCSASVSSRECQAGPGVAQSIDAEQCLSAIVGELAKGLRSLCRLGRQRGPDSSVQGGFSES